MPNSVYEVKYTKPGSSAIVTTTENGGSESEVRQKMARRIRDCKIISIRKK